MRGIPVVVVVVLLASPGTAAGQISQTIFRPDDVSSWDPFGLSVATNGQDIAVSSFDACDPVCSGSVGAVLLYHQDGGQWVRYAKFAGSDTEPGDMFGGDVDLGTDVLVVGSHYHDHGDGLTGSAYVFRRTGSDWVEEAELRPNDEPGWRVTNVAVSGNVVAVGSRTMEAPETGAVAIYRFDGSEWNLESKLSPPGPEQYTLYLTAMALSGSRLVVGAPADDQGVGAVYVYEHDGITWNQAAKLLPDEGQSGYFGLAVDLDGEALAIGSSFNLEAYSFLPRVSILRHEGESWTEDFRSSAPIGDEQYLGEVGLDDGRLLAASARMTTVFSFNGLEWSLTNQVATNALPSVAIAGTVGVLGLWESVHVLHVDVASGATAAAQPATVPSRYALLPGYPNPFNPSGTIAYDLPEAGNAVLSVYDVQGRLVDELQSGFQAAGHYEVRFDAGALPSGIYLYRLESGPFSSVRAMALVR